MVSFERREAAGQWHVVFEVEQPTARTWPTPLSKYSTVWSAVEEFIGVRESALVVFATKRDKLAGAYGTYLRKEFRKLNVLGYRPEGPRRMNPFVEFTLRRERPLDWESR